MKLIPNSNIKIDVEKDRLYELNGRDITEIAKVNGEEVLIYIDGVAVKKPIIWFKHLTILNIIFPHIFIAHINLLEFKKQKPFGVSKAYGYMPIFTQPIEYLHEDTIYRLIPMYPKYMVSEEGLVLSVKDHVEPPVSMFGKYLSSHIYRRNVRLHRLVAMAWVENDDYLTNNIVDHKDNNKLNNHKDNLQWTSNSGNVAKEIHRDVFLICNVDTKEISTHTSLTKICNYIGRSRISTTVTPIIHGRIWKGTKGRYEIERKSTFKGWAWNEDNSSLPARLEVSIDGVVTKYNTLTEVVKKYKLRVGQVIRVMVIKALKLLYNDVNIVIYREDEGKKEIQVKNLLTKEVFTFPTPKEVIEHTGIHKSSVNKYLANSLTCRPVNNYLIRYTTNSPWCDDTGELERVDNLSVCLIAEAEGDIQIFNSYRQASIFFNLDKLTIQNRLNNNLVTEHHGYKYYLKYK